ncbi:G-protein coupled receptor 183-like [Centroberyx affinis]|uniref:G-protein coupled receptor 183-like n=1 Tax=Centroberyx affinis TaxID=166261 RepID=UPI003A5C47AA
MLIPVNITLVPLAFDFDSAGDYLLFCFHIMFGVSAVLLAGSVTVGILGTHNLRIQNRFIFMVNTSISDTLSGFAVFYLCLFDVRVGFPGKNGTFYILTSFLGVNILTFLFAQFDRYFAVCHPFFYSRFITRHLVLGINAYSWIQIYGQLLIQNLLPLSKAIHIQVYGLFTLQFIILTKITMTIKLLVVAKYQLERDPPSPEKESKKESLQIIVMVVVCFLTLWFPSLVNLILRGLSGNGVMFENEAVNPVGILARCNVLCTSALYLWASPSLRAAVWKTVWARVLPKLQNKVAL